MRELLTQKELKERLEYNSEKGLWKWKGQIDRSKKSGWFSGTHSKGYKVIVIRKKPYYAHALAWLYCYGVWPTFIDHINRNRGDNRITNLREADYAINAQNKSMMVTNTSGFTGVQFVPFLSSIKPWRGMIIRRGIRKSKHFASIEEAVEWRRKMEQEFHPRLR